MTEPKVNSKQLTELLAAMKKVCQAKVMDAGFQQLVNDLRAAGKEYDAYVAKENKPTHFHKKSGKEYKLLIEGKNESNSIPVVVYQDAAGDVWVRPKTEWATNFSALLPVDLLEVKKTVITKYEAVQFNGTLEQAERIKDWIGDAAKVSFTENYNGLKVMSPTGKNVSSYRMNIEFPKKSGDIYGNSKSLSTNDWVLKHDNDTFEVVSNYDFGNKGYVPSNPSVAK